MKNNSVCNITFGGIGGQGTLTASEVCGWAAMFAGFHVKKSEVHGMAQRGGSVESHLRFGKRVFSPLVSLGQGDFLVCFHEEEHERLKTFLKPGGVDLFEWLAKGQSEIKDPRHINTYLVGVLSSYLPFDTDCWMKAIEKVLKKKILEENKQVFMEARQASKK